MFSSQAQLPAPRPSSAMSPAGYSLAMLSSNRLRFADRLQWWGSFRLRSTGKTSQPCAGGPLLPSSKPAEMRAFYSGTDIYAGSLDAKPEEQRRRRVLPDRSAPLYVTGLLNRSEGTLLFVRERALMAQTLDPERLELKGEAVAVAQNVANEINVSASDDGKLAYVAALQGQKQLAWFDLQGKTSRQNVGPPQNAINQPRISPEGSRLAFSRDAPDGRSDIFVLNLARASETRVTYGPANNSIRYGRPTGRKIAFTLNRDGANDLYLRAADGSGSDRLLLKNGDRKFPLDWSPDGEFLLFGVLTPKGEDLWTLALADSNGESKANPYLPKGAGGQFSPDGHFVAYVSLDSSVAEVYVSPFDPGSLPATGAANVKVSSHGARGSGRTRSVDASAPAVWAKCIARRIPG